jgi:hypothetical protein
VPLTSHIIYDVRDIIDLLKVSYARNVREVKNANMVCKENVCVDKSIDE